MTVRLGPCQPWITSRQVLAMPQIRQAVANLTGKSNALSDDELNAICADAAQSAQEVLHRLSAQQFAGECGPVRIRPVQRPINADGWGIGMYAYGTFGAFGSFVPFGTPAVVSRFGRNEVPVIQLMDYPVNSIVEVKINGTVIPPIEYELRDSKHLVRILPTAKYVPTEMWGWPRTQQQGLEDTEQGTFSVTYTYGLDPGYGGRRACLALAEFFALPMLGDPTQLPERTTTITRQGVTVQVVSPIDMIAKGKTGITVCDMWLLAVNPHEQRAPSLVLSPDRPTQRRTARPIN